MVRAVVATVVAVALTIGAYVLFWWAAGGGVVGLLAVATMGSLVAYVLLGIVVPMAWTAVDAGSIRRAQRALHEAEEDGRRWGAMGARWRLRLVRWQRRA